MKEMIISGLKCQYIESINKSQFSFIILNHDENDYRINLEMAKFFSALNVNSLIVFLNDNIENDKVFSLDAISNVESHLK